jgi:pyruvate kinase
MHKTKIIGTLGPATNDYETIKSLIEAGLDAARINFSHANYKEHTNRIKLVRKASAKLGKPVAIIQDLQGPKIRTGKLVNGEPIYLQNDQDFIITIKDMVGNKDIVSTTFKEIVKDVKPGDRILLSDGLIELKVKKVIKEDVLCTVINGGVLREKQGINLPGVDISTPSLTEKDKADLKVGLKLKVDYIAMSFVRCAADIKLLKRLIAEAGCDTPVIAKLERPEAITNLDEILSVTDVVMIARGDLGVELPPEQVPLVQKRIIKAANKHSVPVITATQMLDSMIYHPRPSRPETSDVANAIIDGSDAVMLSGETATGKYPLKAVEMMRKIIEQVEDDESSLEQTHMAHWEFDQVKTCTAAIGAAVSTIVRVLPIKAIWAHTMTGSTARLISHYRPKAEIVAFTSSEKVYNRLSLYWGVRPIKIKYYRTFQAIEKQLPPIIKKYKLGSTGDMVVRTGGHPTGQCGPTNFLKIHII